MTKEQSEECAFSGHAVFSRLGRGKDRQNLDWAREKETFFIKIHVGRDNVCSFAARNPA